MLKTFKKNRTIKNLYGKIPSRLRAGAVTYYRFRKMIRKTQYNSPSEIKAIQFCYFRKIIEHTWKNIPGYRDHWKSHGFQPDQFKTIDDIKRIPFLTKEMLGDDLDRFSYKKLPGLQKVTTGGSTGIPFAFYLQRKNGLIELAFIHEIWAQFYPKIDLKTEATILRGKKLDGPVGYDPLLGLVLSSFDLTPQNIPLYIEAIEKYKTPILRAYPSSLYVFANLVESLGFNIKHKFESIMLGSEIFYDFQREQIGRVFNAPVVNWYGHGEKTVLAGFCEYSSKLHVAPLYGYAEVIDTNGNEVYEGETGEIVGTSFWNYTTPFIRYKTKDFARRGSSYCPYCKRHFQLLDEILGREHEFIVDREKKLIALTGVSIVCGTFNHEVSQFRFYQDTIGTIVFKYIKKPGVEKVNTDFIKNSLLEKIGNHFTILFEEVQKIGLTQSGKLMYLDQKLDIKKLIAQ